MLSDGKLGRVPFFVQRDFRTSSLLPVEKSWQQAMNVPLMGLNLILEEEQISLIICDIPAASMLLLAQAELGSVERILVNASDDAADSGNQVQSALAAQGLRPDRTSPRQGRTAERQAEHRRFSRQFIRSF